MKINRKISKDYKHTDHRKGTINDFTYMIKCSPHLQPKKHKSK